jgi:hypothetical protein
MGYYFRDSNTWGLSGRPLYISLFINVTFFGILLFYRDDPVENVVHVSLSPIEYRYPKEILLQKKKKIEKKKIEIKKQIIKKKLLQKKHANSKWRSKNSSSEKYNAPYREKDYRLRTGKYDPDSLPRNYHPDYLADSDNKDYKANNYKKGYKVPVDSDANYKGYGKPGKKNKSGKHTGRASRGKRNWGGPASPGSFLKYAPDPVYPYRLRNKAITGRVKLKVFFLPDGRAYDVQILSQVDANLAAITRKAVLNWRASPAVKKGTRFLITSYTFYLE